MGGRRPPIGERCFPPHQPRLVDSLGSATGSDSLKGCNPYPSSGLLSLNTENKPAFWQFLPDSPPAGTGNLTLADFSARYGFDLNRLLRELQKQDIEAGAASTIKQIAKRHNTSPIDLYETIKEIAK